MVDQLIKGGGGNIFHQAGGFILHADHADDFIALVKFFHDLRQALRRMQVRVHADDTVTARIIDACDHGSLMAEIPGKLHHPHPVIPAGQLPEDLQGPVGAAIVYEQKLVIPGGRQGL